MSLLGIVLHRATELHLCCRPPLDPHAWHFDDEWRHRPDPIPARLVPVAHLDHERNVAADVLSSIEFLPDGSLLATAGVTKRVRPAAGVLIHSRPSVQPTHIMCAQQVRVYSIPDGTGKPEQIAGRPLATQRMPHKLSTLAWSPDVSVRSCSHQLRVKATDSLLLAACSDEQSAAR